MVIEYKCPNCGGSLVFDSETQKMACEHCKTKMTLEELNRVLDLDEEEELDDISKEQENLSNQADFVHYKCKSCGAELLADEHTAATFCSFCGNPSLIEERLSGEYTPAQIIPFRINQEQAREIYRNWCKKGMLTPSDLKRTSTVEKLSGIYVPFWIYDYGANVQIQAECTKVRMKRKGDYEYTYTDYFHVYRDVANDYERVPADASEKMPDDVMDKLEPFSYQDMVPFDMPYLSGYLSEKYNFTDDQMAKRVESRVREYIQSAARATIQGYASVNILQERVHMQRKSAKYTMFPVWILNYRYNGKEYQFALNGQTGKIVANRPISKKRAAACFGIVTAVTFVLSLLVGGAIL